MRWHQHLWNQGRHHLFKGSAFVTTAIIFVLAFVFWPKLVIMGLDANLALLKAVGKIIETQASRWGDSFEAATRFINLERILLFSEAVAVVKLVMLAVGSCFRRFRKRRKWK